MDKDLLSSFLFISKTLLREKFKKFAPRYITGRVLDVGCGKRPFGQFLPQTVTEYVGQDNDPAVNPDILGNATDIAVDNESFDSVLCNEVLEHVYEPQAVLREIHRVFKPGGHVYITVPMMWCLHYEPYDFWRYTPHSLRNLLTEAGFEIKELERSGGVFSMIGQRMSDVLFFKLLFIFKPLPPTIRNRLATIVLIPWNVCFYLLGRGFDWIDKRDALNWVVVAQKI